MLTEQEINEIQNRCNAAPEGPWMVSLNKDHTIDVQRHVETSVTIAKDFFPEEIQKRPAEWDVQDKHDYFIPTREADVMDGTKNKLNFIAYAREDMPKLLAEIYRLKEEVSGLRKS